MSTLLANLAQRDFLLIEQARSAEVESRLRPRLRLARRRERPIVKRRDGLSQIVEQCQCFRERDPWDWRHIAISIELDKLIP